MLMLSVFISPKKKVNAKNIYLFIFGFFEIKAKAIKKRK